MLQTKEMVMVPQKSFIKRFINNMKRYKFIYLLMLPGLLLFLIFNYYPLYFLQVAFKSYDIYSGLDASKWIGFENFRKLFQTKYFLQSFTNTVILSGMKLVFGFPVPIILALLLNEIANKYFKKIVQSLVYLPHFLSWIIVASIFATILAQDTGIVNVIIKSLGMKQVFFMGDKRVFRWVLTGTSIWKDSGWGTIIYLAAISGVDESLYEAAIVEGASRLKQTLYITIPTIMPAIIVVFILDLAKVLNIFEQVFAMYTPVVAEVSETIDTYVYQIGIVNGDVSFATAVGLFKNIISLVLVLSANYFIKKKQGTGVA